MRRKSFFTFLSVLIFVFSGMDRVAAGEVGLEKIVVTPARGVESLDRTTRSVEVITADDIEKIGARSVAEAVEHVAYVNISKYGGLGAQSAARIRGSTAAQVLVMIDGRPINSPRDGEADLSTLSLADVKRIEIMRGAGSSLYGAGAVGGIINVITDRPPKEGFKTEGLTAIGTYRTFIERLRHGGRLDKFGYDLSGEFVSSEGHRANTEQHAGNYKAQAEYDFTDDLSAGVTSGYYRSTSGGAGLITEPDLDDQQRRHTQFFQSDLCWNASEQVEISTSIYENRDRLVFAENTAGAMFDTAQKKDVHATTSRGFTLQVAQEIINSWSATAGFNYVGNGNKSNNSGKHKYNLRAVFLQNVFDIGEDFKLQLGVRHDDYSNFGGQTSPSVSVRYALGKAVFRLGSHWSFRAPTFNDLYWPDEGWVKGNSLLRPETGVTGEAGVEFKPNKYWVSGITYFHSNYNDLINWAPNDSGVWMPQNVGRAKIDGVELAQSLHPVEGLELSAGYTFLRARDRNARKDLVYQPRQKADFAVAYAHKRGFAARLNADFAGLRYYDTSNTVKVKRYYTLDLSLSQKFNEWATVFLWLKNMLDKRYQVIRDYPMPGFSVTAGAKVSF